MHGFLTQVTEGMGSAIILDDIQDLTWLALAGGAGAMLRYVASHWGRRLRGPDSYWRTLAINLLGSFLFGFIWALAVEHDLIDAASRVILLVGFAGSFTTFSQFAHEVAELGQENLRVGVTYAIGTNAGAIVLASAGFALGAI